MNRRWRRVWMFGLLFAIGVWLAWGFSHFSPKATAPSPPVKKISHLPSRRLLRSTVREIPAGDTLSRPSPMDEPAWHRELKRVSEAEKAMRQTHMKQAFVRGYW